MGWACVVIQNFFDYCNCMTRTSRAARVNLMGLTSLHCRNGGCCPNAFVLYYDVVGGRLSYERFRFEELTHSSGKSPLTTNLDTEMALCGSVPQIFVNLITLYKTTAEFRYSYSINSGFSCVPSSYRQQGICCAKLVTNEFKLDSFFKYRCQEAIEVGCDSARKLCFNSEEKPFTNRHFRYVVSTG